MKIPDQRRSLLGKLAGDGAAIVLIQAINFITPLAALPAVSRALGIEAFAVYAALLVYTNYVVLFSDFSFNVTGPIRVRDALRSGTLRPLVLASSWLKLALAVTALAPMALIAMIVLDVQLADLILGCLLALAISLTPRWMMYGLGRLYTFAAISGVVRVAWLFSVLYAVRTPSDLTILMALSVLAQLAVAAACFGIVYSVRTACVSSKGMSMAIFNEDFRQFLGILAASSVRDLGVLSLSVFSSALAVSTYAIADRVRTAIMGLVAPVTQALFLFVVSRADQPDAETRFVRLAASGLIVIGAGFGGTAVYALAEEIALFFGGPDFAPAAVYLKVLAVVPLLTALNSILGPNTLLAEGHRKLYANVQLGVAAVGVPIIVGLSWTAQALGTAIAVASVEALYTIALVLAVSKSGAYKVLLPAKDTARHAPQ